jgi:hypothetical protein
MSKSFGKYINTGIAEGNNSKYYRRRRRNYRIKNKMRLLMAIKEDKDFIEFKQCKKDQWREPTDGTVKRFAEDPVLKKYFKNVYIKNRRIKK